MKTTFNRLSTNKNISAEVVSQIKKHLLNGTLKPGDKLPTEAELVEQFGISRTPLREAIKILESIGVIVIKRGKGMFITTKPSQFSLNPLIFSLIMHNENLDKLIEFRQHFEILMMNVIKTNWTAEKHKAINEVYEYQVNALSSELSAEELAEVDLKFHYALLEATENEFIIEIGKTIYELYKPKMIHSKHSSSVEKTLKAHKNYLNILSNKKLLTEEQIKEMIQFNKEWLEGEKTEDNV
jgi:GntR family transcriptional regulator, transcriptional repressor for pyruvate dehydrogenase complex